MANKFEMIAKTFQGLEEVLAKELQELGAEKVEILSRGVRFYGDQEMLYKANFKCRTALRILKPFHKFEARDTEEVYDIVKAFDWSQYLDAKKTFAIDSVVYSETFKHSKFLAYKVKDAIADHFREKYGERPSVRINNPDIQLNIHVHNESCTLSLDSSGEPLYMRGYKVSQTEAPLNEVMAAGMLKMAGWDGQCDFMDPMCGSGTIAIEAALMALNIAPGIYRKGFAFEKWPDFNQEILDALFEDESEEREFNHKIYASDISSAALRACEENVKRAGMSKYIEISHTPFQSVDRPEQETMLMFNPPYGERLKPANLAALYEEIGTKLKRDFTDMSAWIITMPCEATDRIGLRPSVKYPLLNGSIECEFRKYELFKGRREDFLREKNEGNANAPKWESEIEEESHNSRNGVFLRPFSDRWQREATEDELSEYRARRHERFEKQQAYAERKREWQERRRNFSDRNGDSRRRDNGERFGREGRDEFRREDRRNGNYDRRDQKFDGYRGDRRESNEDDRFSRREGRGGFRPSRQQDERRDGRRGDARNNFRNEPRFNNGYGNNRRGGNFRGEEFDGE
jgi:putative N6-adenine-specific DNA methylase